jgi:hypothetical protein
VLRHAAVATVLGIVVLGVHVSLGLRDVSPPADGDLAAPRSAVPEAANGYRILEEALDAFPWSPQDQQRLTAMRRHGESDEAFVREIVVRGAPALSRLEDVLRAREFASPPMKHLDDDFPDFRGWLRLAEVCAIRAGLRTRAGDLDGALADGTALLRLGNRILADPSAALIHAMVATRVKASGVRALQATLPSLAPTPEQSRAIARRIASERIDPSAWRAMWAEESEVAKGSLAAADAMVEVADGDAVAFRFLPGSYLFHANATIALHADLVRELRSYAGGPCSAIRAPAAPATAIMAELDAVLRPNARDRAYVASASGPLRYAELRRCRSDAELAALEALVALRAHRVRHGALPTSLKALVPEYLDAVPLDPYVAEPLGYDPERRLLLSAGADLEVGPLVGRDDPAFAREPSWPISF